MIHSLCRKTYLDDYSIMYRDDILKALGSIEIIIDSNDVLFLRVEKGILRAEKGIFLLTHMKELCTVVSELRGVNPSYIYINVFSQFYHGKILARLYYDGHRLRPTGIKGEEISQTEKEIIKSFLNYEIMTISDTEYNRLIRSYKDMLSDRDEYILELKLKINILEESVKRLEKENTYFRNAAEHVWDEEYLNNEPPF